VSINSRVGLHPFFTTLKIVSTSLLGLWKSGEIDINGRTPLTPRNPLFSLKYPMDALISSSFPHRLEYVYSIVMLNRMALMI